MAFATGTRLGRYEILGPLGAGGMGAVYRAHDTSLRRDVAIKVLLDEFASDRDRLRRFQREALATAGLNHAHILAVHDVGEHDGVFFVVTELLEGRTLREVMNGRAIAPARAARYASQIAEGLAAAHEKGIVHRDIKPANLFVTRDDSIKILDFGLARTHATGLGIPGNESTETSLTGSGVVLGSAGYMSPEQVRGEPADHRADIFGLGVVLYEMVTGRRAFQRDTVAGTLAAIVEDDPPSETGSLSPQSRRLLRLAGRCLEKAPGRRLQSARDLSIVLLDEAASDAPDVDTAVERGAQRVVRAALITAFVAASVLAIWGWMRPTPSAAALRVALEIPAPEGSRIMSAPAVAASGEVVAFVARTGNTSELFVRRLSDIDPRRLDGTLGASQPFFSPDGRQIAFFAGGQLKVVNLDGSTTFVVCAAGNPRGGAWGDDGDIVFAAGPETGLSRVAARQGSDPVVLTELAPGDKGHRFPVIPRGSAGVIFVRQIDNLRSDVVVRRAGQATDDVLAESAARPQLGPGRLLYVSSRGEFMAAPFDSRSLRLTGTAEAQPERFAGSGVLRDYAYAGSESGAIVYAPFVAPERVLQVVGPDGSVATIPGPPRGFRSPRVAPDGETFAVTVEGFPGWGDVWTSDLRGNMQPVTRDGESRLAAWSPDGSHVTVESQRDGREGLYAHPVASSGSVRTIFRGPASPFSWLPGDVFVFGAYNVQGKPEEITLLRPAGQPERVPLPTTANTYGDVSPDGRWLAYTNNESGQFEVYLTGFPTPGRIWSVSQAGTGREPQWSQSGDTLFFLRQDGRLMSVAVGSEGPRDLAPRPTGLGSLPVNPGRAGDPSYDALGGGRFITVRPARQSEPLSRIVVDVGRFGSGRQ